MTIFNSNKSPVKKIAILYSDAKRQYFPTEEMFITEAEVKGRAQLIAEMLKLILFKLKFFQVMQNYTIVY